MFILLRNQKLYDKCDFQFLKVSEELLIDPGAAERKENSFSSVTPFLKFLIKPFTWISERKKKQ